MNKYHILNLKSWTRTNMFNFYQSFASPLFNISVKIHGEKLYKYAKLNHESFFLLSLYAILRSANEIPQLRQRILDAQVIEFERIAVMTPIMTPDEMFHQIWCEYEDDFATFKAITNPKIESAKNSTPSPMVNHGDDFLCANCAPWLHFESITQTTYHSHQAVPILAWGKMVDGKIPFAIQLNHSFVDGLHTSRFFEKLQNYFDNPELLEQKLQIN